jgi:hypothetical protein
MRQTGHRSLPVFRRYIRRGSLFSESAATKLGLCLHSVAEQRPVASRENVLVARASDTTAEEVVAAACRSIPRATLWRWLVSPRVPTVAEGITGHCKRCGRALPVFSDPLAFGPMGRLPVVRFERSPMESALICLVCGPRSGSCLPFTAEAILGAGDEIGSALSARHWRRWHRTMRRALHVNDEPSRIEQIGQTLELLRRFGPGRQARRRDVHGDPLETLVVSSAALWPSR